MVSDKTKVGIVIGIAALFFIVIVICMIIEYIEDQKMEDICWNHGFSDIVYLHGDFIHGIPFCCDTHERNCKPFVGVEKHKWYGEFCDFLFECVELRRTK